MIKDYILNKTLETIEKEVKAKNLGELSDMSSVNLNIGIPKNEEFGDFAINVAPLARFCKLAPNVIAEKIADKINLDGYTVTVVGSFINFKLLSEPLNNIVLEVLQKGKNYAANNIGKDKKVILEYVSANPTGPFHIGHGRWAAMGSALANVLKYSGYNVYQEFYINDAGAQIGNLGRSLNIRILQELGKDVSFPEDELEKKKYYPGEYLIPVAKKFIEQNPDFAKKLTLELSNEELKVLSDFAKKEMLELQKALLKDFRTDFDNFFSETSLHSSGEVEKCLKMLQDKGMLYEKDNAVWFKSSMYGDDQDRVLKKTDGTNTYLVADIAYHYNKLMRGFDTLLNIWGADHHGYIPRMKAAIQTLGFNPNCLTVLLGQLVNLVINGEQTRMGKRKNMITLHDLIEEVGVDATRFWMIMRSIDTALEFDVELAQSKSDDNPVFYVQYAHARSCSIFRNASAERVDTESKKVIPARFGKKELDEKLSNMKSNDFSVLWESDEKSTLAARRLILKLEDLKSTVLTAARNYAPYLLCNYLQELAGLFHQFYAVSRVLSDDEALSVARLALVKSTIIALETGLELLGVSAPEEM